MFQAYDSFRQVPGLQNLVRLHEQSILIHVHSLSGDLAFELLKICDSYDLSFTVFSSGKTGSLYIRIYPRKHNPYS